MDLPIQKFYRVAGFCLGHARQGQGSQEPSCGCVHFEMPITHSSADAKQSAIYLEFWASTESGSMPRRVGHRLMETDEITRLRVKREKRTHNGVLRNTSI